MPAMPNALPRRDVCGDDSPLSARMKHTDATRYHRATWLALMCFSPDCDQVLGEGAAFASFFLNMESMRWVTRKPPNTLIDANVTASTPTQPPQSNSIGPA